MTERQNELRENYFRVLEKIEEAKIRRGGDKPVTLLAASKTYPAEDITFLVENCGLKLCGENHAQELVDKYDAVHSAGADYDFIGHLQTNKVKYVVGRARLIHSLDSVKLAREIDSRAKKLGILQDCLVEVNIGNEESKSGISADCVSAFLDEISAFESIKIRGMMTMAPKCEKNEDFRKYFQESYRIFLDFFGKKTHNIEGAVLSMGMSDSFVTAIEEGADIVRVGSLIFGSRNYNI